MFRSWLRFSIAVLGLSAMAAAQSLPSSAFTFQGKLTDGMLPADGWYQFIFELYDASAGGNRIGQEQVVYDVLVADGLFTRVLNANGEFGFYAFNGQERWLQVRVQPSGASEYSLLSPRQSLAATPYAAYAFSAPTGHTLDAADGNPPSAVFVNDVGWVGIGTTSPRSALDVVGAVTIDPQAAVNSVLSLGNFGGPAAQLIGYYLDGSLRFRVADAERMVLTGFGRLGIGTSDPLARLDVRGGIRASTGAPVDGGANGVGYAFSGGSGQSGMFSDAGGGIQFYAGNAERLRITDDGRMGIGTATPDSAYRMHIVGDTVIERNGFSFIDLDIAQSGRNRGRFGWDGTSMFLEKLDGNLAGRKIEVRYDGDGARSTEFRVLDPTGDWEARAYVFEDADLGHAGVLEADVLTVPGKFFKIDHPLDPAGKFLYHSCVESPDMKNIYDGVVTTDSRGYATVRLPEYFAALNESFRYQLTVIDEQDGDEFVLAKVVREVNNQFTVRSSAPGVRVSWQLTGIRHDAFARAMPITCEVQKQGPERGRYMHPRLFGQADEMGIKAIGKALPAEGN